MSQPVVDSEGGIGVGIRLFKVFDIMNHISVILCYGNPVTLQEVILLNCTLFEPK